jgi:N-acetylmuramoyl-L-alanine amidase
VSVEIVKREEWGAVAPRERPTVLAGSAIDELVFHYSAALSDELPDHGGCRERVRGIQHHHRNVNGWNDIGYSWLFCKHGAVFEGRGWGILPAATADHNSHTQAICFLGADRDGRDDVTPAGRRAAAFLIDVADKRFEIEVVCHRDRVATACPGDELAAWVQAEGWLAVDVDKRPWPVPIPPWFWAWARWRRRRHLYRNRLAWMLARPGAAPLPIPRWAFARLAAMTPGRG